MMKYIKFIISIILATVLLNFTNSSVEAFDTSVDLEYPTNQLNKGSMYFDLLVSPGQKQDIFFKITNSSDENKEYKVFLSPAVTGDDGVIIYNNKDAKISDNLPFDVLKYVKIDKNKYQVAAKSEISVPIHLNLPDQVFSGRVLAGLTIDEIGATKESSKSNDVSGNINVKISNQIPIALQQTTERPKPKVDYRTTTASLVNGYRNFQVKLENPIANVINGANVKVKIYRNDKVIAKKSFKNGSYAPNTKFNYNVPLGKDEKFVAGKYRAKVTVAAENGNEWNFNEPFTVTPEKAEDLNKKAVSTKAPLNIWLIVAVVFGILTIGVLITLIVYLVKTRK